MTQKKISDFDIRFDDERPDELWREKPSRKQPDPGFEEDGTRGLRRRVTLNAVIIPLFSLVVAAGVFLVLNQRISGLSQNREAESQSAQIIQQRLSALSEAQTFLKGDVEDALKQMEKTAKSLEERIGSLEKSLSSVKKSVSGGLDKKDLAAGIEKAVSPVKKEMKKISDLASQVKSLESRVSGLDKARDLDKKLAGFQTELKKARDDVGRFEETVQKFQQQIRLQDLNIKVLEKGKVDKDILNRALERQKQEIYETLKPAGRSSSPSIPVGQGGVTEQPLD